MKVYIILCEERGYDTHASIEEVWLNKDKAYKRVNELNQRFSSFRHWVEEREVQG